ncbi:hypothetical protein E1B28_000623 [Marasmius oreades]|uniref:Uncharacterized protein n=1 Tax=Marasmius oreades TaxID=181124 RepID=A0A9P7V1P2_9AGAR|nr:uncharacterized protein E1B28_000623 [Marasmius oreades]KAG7098710.1 hypothetical protein E1B28_000623 [Marasmius oreades]
MASPDFAKILQSSYGTPFPGLLEHFFPQHDYDAILEGVNAIPEAEVEARMKFLSGKVPGLPLLADCLAKEAKLKRKRELNATLLNNLGPDEPGINAQVPWQSSLAYNGVFDNLLAKSPVLTKKDIEEAKNIPAPSGGRAYLFELLKIRSSTGEVTEWHWLAIVVTNEGETYFLEGVWNLYTVETANKNRDVLAELYGDITKNFEMMPAPETTFQQLHGGTAIGPEDLTLGGEYSAEKTYAMNSQKAFGWDPVKNGRPFWSVKHVLEYNDLSPERLQHFIAVTSLVKKSNDKGSPLSTGTHYILNSCVTIIIAALFYDDTELQNKPLHELMVGLAKKADHIHVSDDITTTVDHFRTEQSRFSTTTPSAFAEHVGNTMEMKTLRQSHDGQPPSISCYFANHQVAQTPAIAALFGIAMQLTTQALENMVVALPRRITSV